MKIKARKITSASFAEISEVDKAACDLATIQHIELAKRALPDILPTEEPDPAIFPTATEQGFVKRLVSWLRKDSPGEKGGSGGHGGYLATDENGQKHLPTERNGKRDHGLMGGAWAALHGGYRGNKYEGPDKDKAIARLTAMYREEGMDTPKAAEPSDLAKAEILEMAKEATEMEKDELIKELLDRIQKGSSANDLLKGGRMSHGTGASFGSMKKCFGKAAGYFGKAADKYGDDDDVSNGMGHMAMGMQHMSKVESDMGLTPDDRHTEGNVESSSPDAGAATRGLKASDVGDLIKTALAEQLAPIQEELKKTREQAHALELENATLKGQVSTWGAMPQNTGRKPPLTGYIPVAKTDGQTALMAAASGTAAPDLTITQEDLTDVKNGMSKAFHKAYTQARMNPRSLQDPGFNGSMGGR